MKNEMDGLKIGFWSDLKAFFTVLKLLWIYHNLPVCKLNRKRGYYSNQWEPYLADLEAVKMEIRSKKIGPMTEARAAIEIKRKLGS